MRDTGRERAIHAGRTEVRYYQEHVAYHDERRAPHLLSERYRVCFWRNCRLFLWSVPAKQCAVDALPAGATDIRSLTIEQSAAIGDGCVRLSVQEAS